MRARSLGALSALIVATASSLGADAQPIGQPGDWKLVFTDEFNDRALDPGKWTTCYWWDNNGCTNLGNNELQWYKPQNVGLDSGALRLVAVPEDNVGHEGRIYRYASGMVTSGRYYAERHLADRFSFQHGYVEVRAKVPAGQGLWSAIWLLPSDQKSTPEIDIMEVLGHRPDALELHYHFIREGEKQSRGHEVITSDLSRNWHVYGLRWDEDEIIWYLDGVEQWRYDSEDAISREPMYLLINLAVGGDWGGPPDGTTNFPAEFLIDYARIWQEE